MHHHVTMVLVRQMVHHTVAAVKKGGQAGIVITVSKSNLVIFEAHLSQVKIFWYVFRKCEAMHSKL